MTGEVSTWFGAASGAAGLIGAEVPRAWWKAESWLTRTALPAAGVAGSVMLQWGSDRLAEALSIQRSVNQAILNHPDEALELVTRVGARLARRRRRDGRATVELGPPWSWYVAGKQGPAERDVWLRRHAEAAIEDGPI